MSLLAQVNPATSLGTVVYVAPAGRSPLVSVNVANVSGEDASFMLGLVRSTDRSIADVTVLTGGEYTSKPTIVIAGISTTDAAATVESLAVATVSIAVAGSGYSVNDVLTLSEGTSIVSAVVTVASLLPDGGVDTVTLGEQGDYTVLPTGTATLSGGTGTGATATLTWKILKVAVSAVGSGYSSSSTTFSTSGGEIIAATFDAQYGADFRILRDTYHPLTILAASGVLERKGIALSEGNAVVVVSSVPGALNVTVLGYEDFS